MKRYIIVCILAVITVGTMAQDTGYVTLRGKQFYDQYGQPFYPMLMNYYVDFFYMPNDTIPNDSCSNCYMGQTSIYGLTGVYEYADTSKRLTHILQDFYEMRNMGFNTVRLEINPGKNPGYGFNIPVKGFPKGQDYKYVNINPPYDSANAMLQFYFTNLLKAMHLADSAGLKVLMICADGPELINGNAGTTQVDDYRDFLTALAQLINANHVHNLLAYEFYGEPTLSEPGFSSNPVFSIPHTKSEICAIAGEWNTAVKSYDSNHLTTIGVDYLDDTRAWDPTLLSVDFPSVHIYPHPESYEYNANDTVFLTPCINRYKDMFYFYDHHLKRPYIVEETSFPGENPDVDSLIRFPIATYGDENAGNFFVTQTFPVIKSAGASGYGWWQFQNNHWYPSPPDTSDHSLGLGNYIEDYFSLLRYGNPDTTDMMHGYENATVHLRKLDGQTFAGWDTNPPPIQNPPDYGPSSSTYNMSDHYYNPYNHAANDSVYPPTGSPSNYGTLKGHVQDQFGNPIEGAVIGGTSVVGINIKDTLNPLIFYGYYTYTDQNGDFELRAYDYLPGNTKANNGHPAFHLGYLLDNTVEDMKISAYGAGNSNTNSQGYPNFIEIGWVNNNPSYQNFESTNTYILNSLQNQFDSVINYVTVSATRNFQALSTLTAINLTVTDSGQSDLVARNEVHLEPGFEADSGSQVHIYNEPLFADCGSISGLGFRIANSGGNNGNGSGSAAKEVEIDFTDGIDALIYPNPNNGSFTLQLMGDVKSIELNNEIHIKDCLGNEIMSRRFSGQQLQITDTKLKQGIYFMYIQSNGKIIIKKFVIL